MTEPVRQTTDDDLRPFGWMPGGYSGRPCADCRQMIEWAVGKRAWRCRACAIKAKAEHERIQECPMICDAPGVPHA